MSKQKIVIVKGSPRKKGNSCILAEALAKGAKDNGADVEEFFLHEMNIQPCNACDVCIKKPEKGCVIDDDMQKIYTSIVSADSIVITSPIYWFNISAQTKLFIDRLYGLVVSKKNSLKGKRIGIILTYGDTNQHSSGAINAINSFKDIFRYVGAEITEVVHGSAMDAGEIKQNLNLMDSAYKLGKKLSLGK
ncbi:MAG: flavodoxin family protein [Candidatus Hodarchaeales archaeon]|jgi:multimeric flavodoxin WrbA